MTTVTIKRTVRLKELPVDVSTTFGDSFSDHMFIAEYHEGRGWHDARIEPYANFALDPATSMLHYGQAIFDGLKAFRGDDGIVRLFRPDMHAARLTRSAEQLCIPPMPEADILDSFMRLVDLDRRWVPGQPGTALYLRPTIIGSEPLLSVRPARSYLYFLILSPVGAYYAEGAEPVSILATQEFVRASPGGLGAAKTPANYAASLLAAEHAKRAGFSQVLWLDGVERRWIEEVGTMNIMLKIGNEIVTPPLGGTILPGVTRDSALALLRGWGLRVSERRISIDEVLAAVREGSLEEVWGTGTAVVVAPVGEIGYQGRRVQIADGRGGPLTKRLYDAITAIQYGRTEDLLGWTVPVPVFD